MEFVATSMSEMKDTKKIPQSAHNSYLRHRLDLLCLQTSASRRIAWPVCFQFYRNYTCAYIIYPSDFVSFIINYAGNLRTFRCFALTSVKIESGSVKTAEKKFLILRLTLVCSRSAIRRFKNNRFVISNDISNNTLVNFVTYGFPSLHK